MYINESRVWGDNAHTPTLVLNGTNIVLSDKVRYLGVIVDKDLRFHQHVQSVVTTAARRMYNAKNFVYFSSKPLANIMFFQKFYHVPHLPLFTYYFYLYLCQ